MPEPPPLQPDDWLGVDLGIMNIAANSDGTKLRQRFQKKGTKSAMCLLKKHHRKEQRVAPNENPRIAKQWVTQAQDTRRGIALEDLMGIRDRITVHKTQRRRQHSWKFHGP